VSDDKKPFSDPRWNDTSKPKVIGHFDRTDKERAADQKKLLEHLKKIGVLKE